MQFVLQQIRKITQIGSIVTPLKDRIGSQILTHPETIKIARTITEQEAKLNAMQNRDGSRTFIGKGR
jgi:magnesium chelatase subunit I